MDDTRAQLEGEWVESSTASGFVGSRYLHDGRQQQGAKRGRFVVPIEHSGRYEVRLAYTPLGNRASNVQVTIDAADGATAQRSTSAASRRSTSCFSRWARFVLITASPRSLRFPTSRPMATWWLTRCNSCPSRRPNSEDQPRFPLGLFRDRPKNNFRILLALTWPLPRGEGLAGRSYSLAGPKCIVSKPGSRMIRRFLAALTSLDALLSWLFLVTSVAAQMPAGVKATVVHPKPLPFVEGEPLSEAALVTKPAPLEGLLSWTIETRRHRGHLRTLAVSPDGREMATGGVDGAIRLWDSSSGKLLRVLEAHSYYVCSLSWSPDGKVLASAGAYDETVPPLGSCIRSAAAHVQRLQSLRRYCPLVARRNSAGRRGRLERLDLGLGFRKRPGRPYNRSRRTGHGSRLVARRPSIGCGGQRLAGFRVGCQEREKPANLWRRTAGFLLRLLVARRKVPGNWR